MECDKISKKYNPRERDTYCQMENNMENKRDL